MLSDFNAWLWTLLDGEVESWENAELAQKIKNRMVKAFIKLISMFFSVYQIILMPFNVYKMVGADNLSMIYAVMS